MIKDAARWSSPKEKCTRPKDVKLGARLVSSALRASGDGGIARGRSAPRGGRLGKARDVDTG
eukprot:1280599-Pyramimonas_sp.AAC.1